MSDDNEVVISHTLGGQKVHDSRIHIPSEGEAEMALARNTCAQCRYYDHERGQELVVETRFLERLVHEESWQVRHLAMHPNEIGLCGAHDSGANQEHVITGAFHKACEQFQAKRGLVTLRKKGDY